MFDPSQYALLDFGHGRKLEHFGSVLIDRPTPAALDAQPRLPVDQWRQAMARYERAAGDRGEWQFSGELPEPWQTEHGGFRLTLRPTEFGHVGVFPEQSPNWDWIARQVASSKLALAGDAAGSRKTEVAVSDELVRPKILNLFGYTGGSTLAAAAAGAAVTHIDAAETTVAWARRNAEVSGLADRPIRWIVEDATRFVQRELRRGNRYDGVILDPPSYGHGSRGQVWRLDRDLPRLLADCAELTAGNSGWMLLTCHSPGIGPGEVRQLLNDALGQTGGKTQSGPLELVATSGGRLNCGVYARWTANQDGQTNS